jgi:hypothetical protein
MAARQITVALTDHSRRRFPPPSDIDDNGACFIVRDHNRQALSYVSTSKNPAGHSSRTRDEARRIAVNVAKLPELLKGVVMDWIQMKPGERPPASLPNDGRVL